MTTCPVSEKHRRILVTGGAGFIGSHIVDDLLSHDRQVTVLDSLKAASDEWISAVSGMPNMEFVIGDVADPQTVRNAVAGQDMIIHLAGSPDTRDDPDLSDLLRGGSPVAGTIALLEAMKEYGVREVLFASSGAVYGEALTSPIREHDGPLLPLSKYAAGKLAAEAYISAYCHLYGCRAWIFRFGNIVGGRMSRGVIYDFISKLQNNPDRLEILGDGTQQKTYLLIEDCLNGIWDAHRYIKLNAEAPCAIINLAGSDPLSVLQIAEEVKRAMGLPHIPSCPLGPHRGWAGDQTYCHLDTRRLTQLGWKPSMNSREAVRETIDRLLANRGG